jgi:hypothetical protein
MQAVSRNIGLSYEMHRRKSAELSPGDSLHTACAGFSGNCPARRVLKGVGEGCLLLKRSRGGETLEIVFQRPLSP